MDIKFTQEELGYIKENAYLRSDSSYAHELADILIKACIRSGCVLDFVNEE